MAKDPSVPTTAGGLTSEDGRLILGLRLLVARAANKDSLAWWDDESLTPHAGYVLERLFPITPALAARSLALAAATTRHQAACPAGHQAVHLYRLDVDGQETLVLRSISLASVPSENGPISSLEELQQRLLVLADAGPPYRVVRQTDNHGLEIEISPTPPGASSLVHRARTLAWAYMEGGGQPVFPYFLTEVTHTSPRTLTGKGD